MTIRRLLAILMIAGLALAPLSRPAMADASADGPMPAMADMSASAATPDEMTHDMPCCPSKAPMPVDCDKCVFMAACATKCFTGMSAAAFHPLLATSATIAPLRNDGWVDGLGHPPPDHPPRSLI